MFMFDATPVKYQEEALPFPFNNRPFCRYEPIEKKITHARVLIVNDLLRYETDLSDLARADWNGTTESRLRFENKVSRMACNNIAQNVIRLVKNPKVTTVHLSEIAEAAETRSEDHEIARVEHRLGGQRGDLHCRRAANPVGIVE
jgi:hypothetical protein